MFKDASVKLIIEYYYKAVHYSSSSWDTVYNLQWKIELTYRQITTRYTGQKQNCHMIMVSSTSRQDPGSHMVCTHPLRVTKRSTVLRLIRYN